VSPYGTQRETILDYTLLVSVIIVGFVAQLIDGSLGMGYGVISNSFLLTLGIPPALTSSSVHMSKMFTNGASGISHVRFGNVDKQLLIRLIPTGVLGGIVGALVLSNLPHGIARPFVAVYLFIAGILILRKAIRRRQAVELPNSTINTEKKLFPLGALGGFLDAIGGGGWGPVVTSTLIVRGNNPRLSIGSGSVAEFFVSVAIFATFSSHFSLVEQGTVILGLIIGGVLAAPLSAYLCGRLPVRTSLAAVGLLIIAVSVGML
jgi:uncharacterized protein